jgi:uncharacterized protein
VSPCATWASAILSPGCRIHKAVQSIHGWYDVYLTRPLKNYFVQPNLAVFARHGRDAADRLATSTVPQFLHRSSIQAGFETANEYFSQTCPMKAGMGMIRPFLLLQATDNPICPAYSIPLRQVVENGWGVLVTVNRGSHCAFYEGSLADSWLTKVAMQFLGVVLQRDSAGLQQQQRLNQQDYAYTQCIAVRAAVSLW